MGYHKETIIKGALGSYTKVQEELDEFRDAFLQDDKILMACELSDLYGALEALAETNGLTMQDLKKFSDKTKSAFNEGLRV